MQHIINVESSRNPFAIGVVGARLARQPSNLSEAIATATHLERNGYNFSLGVSQVNRYNLAKYGLTSYQVAFDVCTNIQVGSRILRECYDRAQDWGRAFSCYYSGNFVTGYKHGYVQKVFASMKRQPSNANGFNDISIPVYSNSNRRSVAVTRYPAYNQNSNTRTNAVSKVVVTPNRTAPIDDARYLQDPTPADAYSAKASTLAVDDSPTVATQAVKHAPVQDPAFVY